MHWTILATGFLHVVSSASVPPSLEIHVKDVTAPNIVNVHVENANTVTQDIVFTYGKCDLVSFDEIHDTIAKISGGGITGVDIRLVWVVPDDVCCFA
jgi:hypothetical protein